MTLPIVVAILAAFLSLLLVVAATAARPEPRRVPVRVQDRDPRQPRRCQPRR